MTILWLDLETTGLSPTADRILEVACILTDDSFEELWRCSLVTSEALRTDFSRLDPNAIKMHCENGLWSESLTAHSLKRDEVDVRGPYHGTRPYHLDHKSIDHWLWGKLQEQRALVDKSGDDNSWPAILLAGTTVHFDRGFVKAYLPSVDRLLSHRHLDVRAITELVARTWPALREHEPKADFRHRAMPDVEHSLALAKYYRAALAPRSQFDGVGDFGSHGL